MLLYRRHPVQASKQASNDGTERYVLKRASYQEYVYLRNTESSFLDYMYSTHCSHPKLASRQIHTYPRLERMVNKVAPETEPYLAVNFLLLRSGEKLFILFKFSEQRCTYIELD